MSNTITNEQAFDGLYEYYLISPDDDKYDDFDSFWTGVITMVVQSKLGWIDSLTAEGYSKVVEAYTDLVELGFFNREE